MALSSTLLWAGYMKLIRPEELPFPWVQAHPQLALLTGITDLLVGLALLFWRNPYSTLAFLGLMLAAAVFHLIRQEEITFNLLMIGLGSLLYLVERKKHLPLH